MCMICLFRLRLRLWFVFQNTLILVWWWIRCWRFCCPESLLTSSFSSPIQFWWLRFSSCKWHSWYWACCTDRLPTSHLGTNPNDFGLRYYFDLLIFCYERFVILAQFLNRDAGSHCFWSPVVDFLKPAAKCISKTNLSNSENIFASNQKTLGQVGSQNFWNCKTVSKDSWTCSSHHSLSSMKVLIWDLKLINSRPCVGKICVIKCQN